MTLRTRDSHVSSTVGLFSITYLDIVINFITFKGNTVASKKELAIKIQQLEQLVGQLIHKESQLSSQLQSVHKAYKIDRTKIFNAISRITYHINALSVRSNRHAAALRKSPPLKGLVFLNGAEPSESETPIPSELEKVDELPENWKVLFTSSVFKIDFKSQMPAIDSTFTGVSCQDFIDKHSAQYPFVDNVRYLLVNSDKFTPVVRSELMQLIQMWTDIIYNVKVKNTDIPIFTLISEYNNTRMWLIALRVFEENSKK